MKKTFNKVCSLLLAAFFLSSSLSGNTYSNKTFLMPRAALDNMALEYTTWHEVVRKTPINQSGVNLDLSFIYQDSASGCKLGKYFGVDGKNKFEIGYDYSTLDVLYEYILADHNHSDQHSANLKFDPKNTVYGLRLDYYQNLDFALKGLFFKAATPFIHVKNDLRMDISKSDNVTFSETLERYFAGHYENIDASTGNLQSKLTHAKINGSRKVTGFADVDLKLGYKLFDEKRYQVSFDASLTIPTGNKVKGQYLFEPILGNGRHFAIGAGLDSFLRFWEHKKQSLDIVYAMNYKYVLEGTEKRTINYRYNSDKNFAQYYLIGQVAPANTPLIPAANLFTRDLKIIPGNQLEALLDIAYNNGGFTLDLGYNLFVKEAEHLKLKHEFINNKYYLPDYSYSTQDAFKANEYGINEDNLDLNSARMPGQFTHKFLGGFGYRLCKHAYTALFGIGGSYEFVTDNNQIENWALWGKFGLTF